MNRLLPRDNPVSQRYQVREGIRNTRWMLSDRFPRFRSETSGE